MHVYKQRRPSKKDEKYIKMRRPRRRRRRSTWTLRPFYSLHSHKTLQVLWEKRQFDPFICPKLLLRLFIMSRWIAGQYYSSGNRIYI